MSTLHQIGAFVISRLGHWRFSIGILGKFLYLSKCILFSSLIAAFCKSLVIRLFFPALLFVYDKIHSIKKPPVSKSRDERLNFRGTTLLHPYRRMPLTEYKGILPIFCHCNGWLPTKSNKRHLHANLSTSALQGQFGMIIRSASHQPAALCSDYSILISLFIVFRSDKL